MWGAMKEPGDEAISSQAWTAHGPEVGECIFACEIG